MVIEPNLLSEETRSFYVVPTFEGKKEILEVESTPPRDWRTA